MCLFWVPAHVLFSSRLLLKGSRGMVLLDMDCSPLHLQQVWSVWKGATNWLHEFFSEITENPTLDCWNWPAVFTMQVLHWDVCARTVAARQPCTMPHRPSSLAPRGSVLLRSLCNGWHMLARWLHLKCFQTMCTSNYQRFHFSKLLMGTCHFYRMLARCFVHGISCVGWCRLLGPCPPPLQAGQKEVVDLLLKAALLTMVCEKKMLRHGMSGNPKVTKRMQKSIF